LGIKVELEVLAGKLRKVKHGMRQRNGEYGPQPWTDLEDLKQYIDAVRPRV